MNKSWPMFQKYILWLCFSILILLAIQARLYTHITSNLANLEIENKLLNAFQQSNNRSEVAQWLNQNFINPDGAHGFLLNSDGNHAVLNAFGDYLINVDDIRLVVSRIEPTAAVNWLIQSAVLQCWAERCDQAESFLQVFNVLDANSQLSPEETTQLAETDASLAKNYAIERKSPEKGLPYLQQALALSPDNCKVLINASFVYRAFGQMEDSTRAASKATSLCPDSADAWHVFGVQMRVIGNVVEAEQSFRKALSLGNSDVWTDVELASLLFDQNRCEEALPYLSQAITRDPDIAYFRFLLGKTYVCLGDTAKARQVYQDIQSIDTNYAEQLKNIIDNLTPAGGMP